jgi:hypothetical protein
MYGSLSSQRVLNILLLGKVIKYSCLLTHASINKGTNTFEKLLNTYKIPKPKMNVLLTIVAMKYKVEPTTAENIICEALCDQKVIDCQLPSQPLYTVTQASMDIHTTVTVAYWKRFDVQQIFYDGSTRIVQTSFMPMCFFTTLYIHWWYPKPRRQVLIRKSICLFYHMMDCIVDQYA